MSKDAYASYKIMPEIPYRILEYLMNDKEAEIIWKLLKYNDKDAYKQPNLTMEQKTELIYPGGEHQENYRIFFDFVMNDATDVEGSFLRIYPASMYPETRTIGICGINFEVLVHGKLNHLSNYTTRVDVITQKLIEVLNGADVGTIGVLYYDGERSDFDKTQLLGQTPYKGKVTTMSVNIG
jgi:hypothetical protein